MMEWPKEVPILEHCDIHKGNLHSVSGERSCLIGWALRTFPYDSHRIEAKDAIRKAIYCQDIVGWNDSEGRTKIRIAEVWNEAMAILGYTEITNA